MSIGVIDYGVGNFGSIMRVLELLQVESKLLVDSKDAKEVECLILPGVGNFANCARLLKDSGWGDALRKTVLEDGKPLLGICVGMQLLADSSDEGSEDIAGLGFIPGKVKHLRSFGCELRVPHVGWNSVVYPDSSTQLFKLIPESTDFYFVHSYAMEPHQPADIIALTDYGIPITAAVRRGNVWGTQFHPEKSSKAGFQLMENFVQLAKC